MYCSLGRIGWDTPVNPLSKKNIYTIGLLLFSWGSQTCHVSSSSISGEPYAPSLEGYRTLKAQWCCQRNGSLATRNPDVHLQLCWASMWGRAMGEGNITSGSIPPLGCRPSLLNCDCSLTFPYIFPDVSTASCMLPVPSLVWKFIGD